MLMMTVTDPSPPHDLIPTTTLRSSSNETLASVQELAFAETLSSHLRLYVPPSSIPLSTSITSTSHHHQPSPDSLKLPVSDRIRTAHPACCIIVAQSSGRHLRRPDSTTWKGREDYLHLSFRLGASTINSRIACCTPARRTPLSIRNVESTTGRTTNRKPPSQRSAVQRIA